MIAKYECNVGFIIRPKESSIRSCNTKARHLDKGVSYGKNEWSGTDPVCVGKNIIMIYLLYKKKEKKTFKSDLFFC